jgi:hypothetical protein
MIPVVCGLFALILFFFVFYMDDEVEAGQEKTRLGYLYERKEAVYDNLRDLNFEYKAGKFPEIDYHQMRASLEEEAAQVLAEIAALENNPGPARKSQRKGARA